MAQRNPSTPPPATAQTWSYAPRDTNSNQQSQNPTYNGVSREKASSITKPIPTLAQDTILVPPIGQFLINFVLQLAAFAAAIAFGVFAIKSVDLAAHANTYASEANAFANEAAKEANKKADDAADLALMANRLALLTLCLSDDSRVRNISYACEAVLATASRMLPGMAESLFPLSMATSTGSPRPTSSGSSGSGSPSSAGVGEGKIVGIVVGVVVLLALGAVALCVRRRRRMAKPLGHHSSMKQENGAMRSFRRLFVDTRVVAKED